MILELDCAHSQDFRSVIWRGKLYFFTPNQAAIVEVLWGAYLQGPSEVGTASLLESAGIAKGRSLSAVFGRNKALGTMIIKGHTQGSYRLSPPIRDPKAPPIPEDE